MPYQLKGNCVVKSDTGETVKCHETHRQAVKHLAALQVNVEDAKAKEYEGLVSNATVLPDVSGWGLTPEQAVKTGTILNLFNGKVHQAMTLVTDQLAMRGYLSEADVKLFTDLKGQMLKLFNEQCPPELASKWIAHSDLQDIATKEYKIEETPSLFLSSKELKDSPYDWVLITSSAYRDRDGQIVSLAAHQKDIARMEQTGDYGTLDWWHLHPVAFQYLENPREVAKLPLSIQQKGVILGDCTLSAMYNKLRIEAGTYRSKEIKDVMDAHAKELSASLLFLHPRMIEPDINGVYHNIATISRAIMPNDKVSNLAAYLSSAAIGVN